MRYYGASAMPPAKTTSKSKAKPVAKAITRARPAAASVTGLKKGDHAFLVDGSSYIFRAYHALPPLTRKSDGLQVNAVLGFCNMLWKLLRDMKPEERPTHLAVVFDKSEKTFRNELYAEYKAHRPDAPADLIPQFPLIREAVHAFDLPCLEQIGFEADDLIATYSRIACEAGATMTIVASDKDLMQLINDCVLMYDTMKDKRIGRAEVIEKFGVPPEKVIEVQSLTGEFDDYADTYVCPVTQLYSELIAAGFIKFAARVANGEFDATKEESDEWARSPSGQAAAKELPPEMCELFGLKLNN